MKALKVFFLIIVLMVAGLFAVYLYSGSILKKGITEAGPAIAGVPIELESISADPIKGAVKIDDLIIHNPEKFPTDYAFKINNFAFDIDPASTFRSTVHIKDIVIDGATVISDGLAADNHRAILKNIQSKIGGRTPDQPDDKDSEKSASSKKVIIDHFAFKNSSLAIFVDGEEITKVDFPDVELKEIGTKGNAVTAAQAIAQIYGAIASETTKVLTVNEEVIENIARAKLKKIGINNMEDLKNPKKLLEDPKAVETILNALTKPEKTDE